MSEIKRDGWRSFAEFYPFYLSEHLDPVCRTLHFIGAGLMFATLGFGLVTGRYAALGLIPVFGYGFAWIGHFVFEKNRPATFRAPGYSLMGDFRMFFDLLTGRQKFRPRG